MKDPKALDSFLKEEVNINPSRLDRLNTSVRAVTEYLSQNLDGFQGAEPQGSSALGTVIKPVAANDEYDSDRLIFMKYDPAKRPADYINAVYHCLRQNGNYADKAHRQTRCVYIDYAGDFHLDLVPCVAVNGRHFVCNNKTNRFEETDGDGYQDWFNAKTRRTNGHLKGVTRLLKYLRDHKDNFTAPSILLTTLIGNSVYESDSPSLFPDLPETLRIVSNRINDFLQRHQSMPEIRNPALSSETFTRHWDPAKYRNFREKFRIYTEKINASYMETDPQKSVQKWRDLFGDGFGRSVSRSNATRGTAPGKSSRPGTGTASTTAGSVAGVSQLPPRSVTPRKPYAR